ncbi:MAG: hypothetical protein KJ643_15235 [Gammaproteobacteria bacterium]|uniref:hypothetical protein n=1 Tax=Pseudomonas mandelii TaxID=75612 RepID=UPI0012B290FD|nr:hypothetical protein [Pseudomonas mandelii]MBU0523586.1 hypothetical protein [Gammaproteobacteria bacterium]MBU0844622.1 hypothetical protein [Gammaproteobacteria bacterium]MBU1843675.1 hypothetical protein [Gammaproteobacteria bacterium]MSU92837.1 hypothetical protein [Pseudomonas mandelii]
MKTVVTLAACLLAITGCQDSEEKRLITLADAAKKSIAARYKDPDAVQFKGLVLDWQQQHICGELNAKNAYGGYIGYERFRADLNGSGANTTVTNVRTQMDMAKQLRSDVETGQLTAPRAEVVDKLGFEIMCADVALLKGGKKTPINIPPAK